MKNKVKTIRLKPGLEVKGGDIITEDMIEEVIIKQAPKKLAKIDFTALEKICQDYIDYCASDEYHEDNDYEHYIYETALETVFGEDIWKFINNLNS